MLDNSYILDQRKIAYTYNLTTAAAALAVSLVEVKAYLKLDAADTSEDAILTMLIEAATEQGEKYTGRDFINKGYTTFRDGFYDPLELRKAKVSTIGSISYLVSGVFTALSVSVYGLQNVNDYPYIYLQDGQSWPENLDTIPQAVKIVFTSGYGAASSSIPSSLKMAILNHVNYLYSNRGDCASECSSGGSGSNLPGAVKSLYSPFRIINIGSYERPASFYRGY